MITMLENHDLKQVFQDNYIICVQV